MQNQPKCIPDIVLNYYDGNQFVDLSFDRVYHLYQQKYKFAGIYIYLNKITNNFYIGQSKNIFFRLYRHQAELILHTTEKEHYCHHQLKYIDYDKYGNSKYLVGIVIEESNRNRREKLEKEIIMKSQPPYNYLNREDRGHISKTGKIIKELRTKQGMTQVDLANLAGISPAFISLLESGERNDMNVKIADRVAGALGITLNEFMDRID